MILFYLTLTKENSDIDYNYDEDYDDFEADPSKQKSVIASRQSKPVDTSQNFKQSSGTANYSNDFSERNQNKFV